MWIHKKYGDRAYKGAYRWVCGEREFILTSKLHNGNMHRVSFESHQAAKGLGWKKS